MPIDSSKDEQNFSLKGSVQKGKEYIDTQFELFKLNAIDKASHILARLLVDIMRAIFALFVLFFLSMALGFYLSSLLNSNALGFLATAGIFIFFIVLLSLFSTQVKRIMVNFSVRRIFEDTQEDDDTSSTTAASPRNTHNT